MSRNRVNDNHEDTKGTKDIDIDAQQRCRDMCGMMLNDFMPYTASIQGYTEILELYCTDKLSDDADISSLFHHTESRQTDCKRLYQHYNQILSMNESATVGFQNIQIQFTKIYKDSIIKWFNLFQSIQNTFTSTNTIDLNALRQLKVYCANIEAFRSWLKDFNPCLANC